MRAWVIGNVALDETVAVANLPTPGASIHGRAMARDLGGKGANQAIVLGRAGLVCRLGAAVGEDARAAEIRARLAAEPVDAWLQIIHGVASDFSIVLIAGTGENAIITTNAAASTLGTEAALAMLAGAEAGDLLVLQGNLSESATLAVLRQGRALGLRTAVNPSPLRDFFGALWPLVDMAFVNEGEAAALGGTSALLSAGVAQVVLTLGPAGARLMSRRGTAEVPAMPCAVIDTTGAGDCFMATALASASLRNTVLDSRALRHGAASAAITVSRPGTVAAFPSSLELARILAQG